MRCFALLAVMLVSAPALAEVPKYELNTSISMIKDGVSVPFPTGIAVTIEGFKCSVDYASTSPDTFYVGPQIVCKAGGTSSYLTVSARCDIRKPGDEDATAVHLISDTKPISRAQVHLMCNTTYSAVRK